MSSFASDIMTSCTVAVVRVHVAVPMLKRLIVQPHYDDAHFILQHNDCEPNSSVVVVHVYLNWPTLCLVSSYFTLRSESFT